MIPIAGSAYTYAYVTLGEFIAWIIGWDLILEYAVGNVAVAVSLVGLLPGRSSTASACTCRRGWCTTINQATRVARGTVNLRSSCCMPAAFMICDRSMPAIFLHLRDLLEAGDLAEQPRRRAHLHHHLAHHARTCCSSSLTSFSLRPEPFGHALDAARRRSRRLAPLAACPPLRRDLLPRRDHEALGVRAAPAAVIERDHRLDLAPAPCRRG